MDGVVTLSVLCRTGLTLCSSRNWNEIDTNEPVYGDQVAPKEAHFTAHLVRGTDSFGVSCTFFDLLLP
jgi:hypothetical protein